MPYIALCADKCSHKKCYRHPDQYKPHGYQTYAYFKGTKYCPLTKEKEKSHA